MQIEPARLGLGWDRWFVFLHKGGASATTLAVLGLGMLAGLGIRLDGLARKHPFRNLTLAPTRAKRQTALAAAHVYFWELFRGAARARNAYTPMWKPRP